MIVATRMRTLIIGWYVLNGLLELVFFMRQSNLEGFGNGHIGLISFAVLVKLGMPGTFV